MTQKQEELIIEAVDKKKGEIDELMELHYRLSLERLERYEEAKKEIEERTKKH